MVNIDTVKGEIVERLTPLGVEKIILFGSYAEGTPTESSDIDLFLLTEKSTENIEAKALFLLRDLMRKYRIGFDVLSATREFLAQRIDPFYREDILKKGRLIYGE